jgi:hypothetical protein
MLAQINPWLFPLCESRRLFAAIAIALASDFLPPCRPLVNEMEATHPLV